MGLVEKLEKKIKVKHITKTHSESDILSILTSVKVETLILNGDEMFDILMSVEGMDEDLADRIIDKIGQIMEDN